MHESHRMAHHTQQMGRHIGIQHDGRDAFVDCSILALNLSIMLVSVGSCEQLAGATLLDFILVQQRNIFSPTIGALDSYVTSSLCPKIGPNLLEASGLFRLLSVKNVDYKVVGLVHIQTPAGLYIFPQGVGTKGPARSLTKY